MAPPSFKRPQVLYPDLVLHYNHPDFVALLLCPECKDVVDRSVTSECQHLDCLTKQYRDLLPGAKWMCPTRNCEQLLLEGNSPSEDVLFKRVHELETSVRSLKVRI